MKMKERMQLAAWITENADRIRQTKVTQPVVANEAATRMGFTVTSSMVRSIWKDMDFGPWPNSRGKASSERAAYIAKEREGMRAQIHEIHKMLSEIHKYVVPPNDGRWTSE